MWDARITHQRVIGANLTPSAILSTKTLDHSGLAIVTEHSDVPTVSFNGTFHSRVLPVLHGNVRQSDGVGRDGPSNAIHVAMPFQMTDLAIIAIDQEEAIIASITLQGLVLTMQDLAVAHASHTFTNVARRTMAFAGPTRQVVVRRHIAIVAKKNQTALEHIIVIEALGADSFAMF